MKRKYLLIESPGPGRGRVLPVLLVHREAVSAIVIGSPAQSIVEVGSCRRPSPPGTRHAPIENCRPNHSPWPGDPRDSPGIRCGCLWGETDSRPPHQEGRTRCTYRDGVRYDQPTRPVQDARQHARVRHGNLSLRGSNCRGNFLFLRTAQGPSWHKIPMLDQARHVWFPSTEHYPVSELPTIRVGAPTVLVVALPPPRHRVSLHPGTTTAQRMPKTGVDNSIEANTSLSTREPTNLKPMADRVVA